MMCKFPDFFVIICSAVYAYQIYGYQLAFPLHNRVTKTNDVHLRSQVRSFRSLYMTDTTTLHSEDLSVTKEIEDKKETFLLSKSLILHVYVDSEIRQFLKMKNSERKARILLPQEIEKITVKMLRDIVEKKLPKLCGEPYVLRYTLPGEMTSTKQFYGMNSI